MSMLAVSVLQQPSAQSVTFFVATPPPDVLKKASELGLDEEKKVSAIECAASQALSEALERDANSGLPITGGGGSGWRKLKAIRRAVQLCAPDSQGNQPRLRASDKHPHEGNRQLGGDELHHKQQASEQERAEGEWQVQVQAELLQQEQQLQSKRKPEDPASAKVQLATDSSTSRPTTGSHKTSDSNVLTDISPESTNEGALIHQDGSLECGRNSPCANDGEEESRSEQQVDTDLKDMMLSPEAGGDTDNLSVKKHIAIRKLRHAASRIVASDLLDNRIYRNEASTHDDISNKVILLDNSCLDDEAIKTHGSWKDRRKKIIRPCLKAVSSYGPGKLESGTRNPRDLQKRQRVRFCLPKNDRGLGRLFAVFEPDSAIVEAWSTFLVLPMAYELWAGAFRLALGTPQQRWLYTLDLASDGCFVADGMIQLNTALKQNQDGIGGPSRSSDTLLIRSRRSIAQRYFTHNFPFLILSSVIYHTGRWMSSEEVRNRVRLCMHK